jgi:flagellin
MALTRINNNVAALDVTRNLDLSANALKRSLEKLATGLALNRASDGAALLSISENLRSQISGLDQAVENASSGADLANTADGALVETSASLQRVRTLAVQAGNGVYTSDELQSIQGEIDSNLAQIDQTNNNTQFGSKQLFGQGSAPQSFSFQIGAGKGQSVSLKLEDAGAQALGVADVDVTQPGGAESALASIDQAIHRVSSQRAEVGAFTDRLGAAINSLGVSSENLIASESRIRDTDFAQEITRLTKNQILLQAGLSIQTQANLSPRGVLALLG